MDKLFLKLIMMILRLVKPKGVELDKLQQIVETKLIMDKRRVRGGFSRKKDKESNNQMIWTLVMYAFFGFFMAMFAFQDNMEIKAFMVILQAYLMVMMVMTLITDFSSVLLDTTDTNIILPKPVQSRTFFMSRVVHIFCYLLQLLLAITLFPAIAVFYVFGLKAGLFALLSFILITILSVFLTYLLYGLLLRFTSEQRLKEIIAGFQIAMTVFMIVGYQLVVRLVDFTNLAKFNPTPSSYWAPPVWFGIAAEAIHNNIYDGLHITMLLLALFVPILMGWLMMKYIAPYFSSKLGNMNAGDSVKPKTAIHRSSKMGLVERLSKALNKTPVSRAAFETYWKLMGREKQFKMQFYPSLAYILLIIIIQFMRRGQSLTDMFNELQYSKTYLWILYFPMLIYLTGLSAMKIYEKGDAGWIYYSMPIEKPGQLLTGGVKALLVKFGIPVMLILAAFTLFVWGIPTLDDIALAACNTVLACYLIELIGSKILPFTKELNTVDQTGKFIRAIFLIAGLGILIGLHYLISKNYYIVQGMIPVSLIAIYFCNRALNNVPWKKIEG